MCVFTYRLLHMKYAGIQDKNFGILHDTIGPTYKKLQEFTHLQQFNDVMMGQGRFILVP
jgi:hypothetical protein